jgi:hypothetical protein
MMLPGKDPGMTDIYLEMGTKKIAACSLEWPGWCKFGKTEAEQTVSLRRPHCPHRFARGHRRSPEQILRRFSINSWRVASHQC